MANRWLWCETVRWHLVTWKAMRLKTLSRLKSSEICTSSQRIENDYIFFPITRLLLWVMNESNYNFITLPWNFIRSRGIRKYIFTTNSYETIVIPISISNSYLHLLKMVHFSSQQLTIKKKKDFIAFVLIWHEAMRLLNLLVTIQKWLAMTSNQSELTV